MSLFIAVRARILFCTVLWLCVATLFPLRAASFVTVKIQSQAPSASIGTDFTGLSFEMQRVLADTNGDHFFSADNRQLIATFKTLGIKSLRVGGNTADRPSLPVPGKTDVDNLFAFAKAAGVKVIYTLRLNHGSPAAAAELATYIARRYPAQLDCFAIGNEPNVFSTNYDEYINEWKRFAAQITTNLPDVKFCGPGVSPGHEKWSARFAAQLAGSGQIKFISQHDYPGGDARRVKDPAVGRDRILSPDIDEHYARFAANFVPTVLANDLPYRFEEANSFYDGGALDVSDTFAAALWALDFQWWWASHGNIGINFHTGDKVAARDENKPCRYATFWTVPDGYNVHPIGYALKMFSLGGQGRLLPVKIEDTNDLNLVVYAAATSESNLCVTLINREHGETGRPAEIILRSGLAKAQAQVMFLTAPAGNVAAKTGITLGDAAIQDNAAWNGKWASLDAPDAAGNFILNLPAASAALVKIAAE